MRKWLGILGMSRALRIEGARRTRDCAIMAITPVKRYTITPWRKKCIIINGLATGGERVRTAGRLAMNGTETNATALNTLNKWRV